MSREREYQLFLERGIDLDTRTLYIGDEITAETASDIIKGLHLLNERTPDRPIHVIINSGGGCWENGMAVYGMMRRCPAEIRATVLGQAQSMATVILQAADYRAIDADAFLMLHDGSVSLDESHSRNFTRYAEQESKNRERMYQIYAESSNKPASFYRRVCAIDYYLNPEQALELGLVDQII